MFILAVRAAAVVAACFPILASAQPLTLAHALELAVKRSESAAAARAGALSATESARTAGQLPDPMLGLSAENLPVTGMVRRAWSVSARRP